MRAHHTEASPRIEASAGSLTWLKTPHTLGDYLRIVRRDKILVALAAGFGAALGLLFWLTQPSLYQASAEVLLSRQNLAASLTGTPDPTPYQQAERYVETQADLARMPAVAERTLEALGFSAGDALDLLEASEVNARPNADLLEIVVRDPSASLAARFASEYARQFTLFRLELDTAALSKARSEVEETIAELDAAGEKDSALYATLIEKQQQLSTLEALQTSNAFVVRPAEVAEQVRLSPVEAGVIGFFVGLVGGILLAFLRSALDSRIRSADEVTRWLEAPLLARIPDSHALRSKNQLAMLAAPSSVQAEAFRMLRANLDFVNIERRAISILVTSAGESEGKSTTLANLAVACARAGRRVVLVDVDLRRPSIAGFFSLAGRPGLTDVALGRNTLEEAVVWRSVAQPDALPPGNGDSGYDAASNGSGEGSAGLLGILPSGALPPNPGEFVGSSALREMLERLRGAADLVLIDAPPLLMVGDGLTLSSQADGLLVVARPGLLRRNSLAEFRQALGVCPAPTLGVVITDAGVEEGYGYGYRYRHGYESQSRPVPAWTAPEREPVA